MEDIEFSKRMKRLGRPACLRAKVRTSGGAGGARRAAHRRPHVAIAPRLLPRRSSGRSRTALRTLIIVFRSRRCRAKRRRALFRASAHGARRGSSCASRATRSPSRRPRDAGRSSCTSRAGIRSSSGPGCSAAVISALAWRARLLGPGGRRSLSAAIARFWISEKCKEPGVICAADMMRSSRRQKTAAMRSSA